MELGKKRCMKTFICGEGGDLVVGTYGCGLQQFNIITGNYGVSIVKEGRKRKKEKKFKNKVISS